MLLDVNNLQFDKVKVEVMDECTMYIGQKGDNIYAIYVYNKRYLFFKILKNEHIEWDCVGAMYSPYGLFGFPRDEKQLSSEIMIKLGLIR